MQKQEKETVEETGDSEKEEGGYVKDEETVESDNGPDVDKKADEFIAKFREQIRLQRIASIRKSTTQNGPR
ncbi:hypothetical protein HanIR_Chr17g0868071 [Helianthus annuus]|nr:hypothetical protein HanIR_Chr17g0868071 [Helianthus annuus]